MWYLPPRSCQIVSQLYKKNFDFPKQHHVSHVLRNILKKASTHNYSTRPGESTQQEIAAAYKNTNGKNAEDQVRITSGRCSPTTDLPRVNRFCWTKRFKRRWRESKWKLMRGRRRSSHLRRTKRQRVSEIPQRLKPFLISNRWEEGWGPRSRAELDFRLANSPKIHVEPSPR